MSKHTKEEISRAASMVEHWWKDKEDLEYNKEDWKIVTKSYPELKKVWEDFKMSEKILEAVLSTVKEKAEDAYYEDLDNAEN